MNKNSIKFIVAILLALLICFTFAACGDKAEDTGSITKDNSTATPDNNAVPDEKPDEKTEEKSAENPTEAPLPDNIDRKDTFRVNCGGEEYTDPNGNVWEADQEYAKGSHGRLEGSSWFFEGPYANTELQELFETLIGEIFIEYQFDDILPGNYNVKLFTSEPRWFDEDPETLTKSRIFNVLLNNVIVEENVHPYEIAGFKAAIILDYTAEVKEGGSLNIFLDAMRDLGVLNAIEITPIK